MINILQIVFLENIFLALTDEEKVEKVNRERDNADMSEHSNNQLSKKKPLGLIRKMRNVVTLSLFYYKQKNDLLSQHPNDRRSHTLTEWSFAQRTQPGEPHCSHWTIFFIKPFLQLMVSHLNSPSAWLQSLLGTWDCWFDVQGKQTRSRTVDSGADMLYGEVSYLQAFSWPAQPEVPALFLSLHKLLSQTFTRYLP